jgi:predicted GNAT family acetyltransferase
VNDHGDMTPTSREGAELAVTVTNNAAARRYEAHVDGELAGLVTYLLDGGRVVFPHAEVYPRWEDKGVGSSLARAALDDVVAQGKLITPKCPFIVNYVRHHPAYLEHVDPRHRAELEASADPTTSEGA